MSEFKYACPVCGQHMKCDSSQSGTVMECPTCFQKIVAPQAPANADPKFILTGSKYVEKKITAAIADNSPVSAPKKDFPLAVVIVLAVVLAAGAAVLVFHGFIFKPQPPPPKHVVAATNAAPAPKPKPVVAPPANDTNWLLTLDDVVIPSATAAGRIHGQDFIIERAIFQNGVLTLRAGTKGKVEFGVQINFSGAQPEALSGQSLNVTTDADKAARVTLHWKEGDQIATANFDAGYALRLEFGTLAKDRLPGKIYLCTPDPQKSYLMGTFNADARKPKPKAPAPPPKK